MRKDLFAIPIFEDKVNLSLIKISEEETQETWDSRIQTTFFKNHEISEDTWNHLIEVITKNINTISHPYKNPRIDKIWRNVYTEKDYQDPHIHPHCQWSFIIYETVPKSKTVLFNPSMKDIQNQIGQNVLEFPLDYKPNLEKGSILIFPSFLLHMVLHGNSGSTIAGNIKLEYL
jgi:hypothetical protein